MVGGAQERARRAGIENVPAIVGFGAAAALVDAADDEAHASARSPTGWPARRVARVPGVERFGDPDACLPHLVCLGIDGVEAEPILLALDQRGVAVHSGSSCSSETLEPSPVLAAMGVDADRSLRASVGLVVDRRRRRRVPRRVPRASSNRSRGTASVSCAA